MLAVILGALWVFAKIVMVFSGVMLVVAYLPYFERKIAGHIQVRPAPMLCGPHGILQPIADGLKLFIKEDFTPAEADKALHTISPLIILTTSLIVFVAIPFGEGCVIAHINIGVLFILAVSSMGIFGIIMGGWSSNSKYSLIGGLRAGAQMIAYEVPLALSIVAAAMLAESLDMTEITLAQAEKGWFIWLTPLGFVIYLISSVAETNRLPFDMPEAESELVAGFHTEYSGMKFAFYFLAEYANLVVVAAIAVSCFLGGWLTPHPVIWLILIAPFVWGSIRYKHFSVFFVLLFLLGSALVALRYLNVIGEIPVFWYAMKVFLVQFFFIWIRWTYPRFRYDQVMNIGWLWLLPLALFNVILVGALEFLEISKLIGSIAWIIAFIPVLFYVFVKKELRMS